ncbi:MAG TPA: hypothetical protein VHF06_29450 [Pseudonocardiaceae bacterium]|jgi:hypothetical protein|nr:hypothetical protein [Pseudonocardiaceae bacterium]
MTASTIASTIATPLPTPTRISTHQPEHARSPVGRALAGTAAAARFTGHFVAACVSVAVLGVDADL